MNTSTTLTKILPSLLLSQKEIETVKKEANNPYFHSKYADLNSLIDSCKEILNNHDVVVLQPINEGIVETILLHVSGEWVSSQTKIVCKSDNNPQDQGSAITYARRYGLQSLLFMSAEDDDGEKAANHTSPNAPQPTDVIREPVDISMSATDPNNEFNKSKCKYCGAAIAISKNGKPYCVNRCWLPENQHLQFKNKK